MNNTQNAPRALRLEELKTFSQMKILIEWLAKNLIDFSLSIAFVMKGGPQILQNTTYIKSHQNEKRISLTRQSSIFEDRLREKVQKIHVTFSPIDSSTGPSNHIPLFETLFIRNMCLFDSGLGFIVCFPQLVKSDEGKPALEK